MSTSHVVLLALVATGVYTEIHISDLVMKQIGKVDTVEIGVFRPNRPGIRKVLGDLEAEIMELIWSRPAGQGTTVREVFETLYERRRIAYTTVMNTMTRLAKKHLLRTEKVEQAYVYYPTVTQDEFISRFVGRILEDLLVNFSGPTQERLAALATPDAARRVQRLMDEISRRRAGEEYGEAGDGDNEDDGDSDEEDAQ